MSKKEKQYEDSYWGKRSDYQYYKWVKEQLESIDGTGKTFLDVGGGPTPVCTWGKFDGRLVVDRVIPPLNKRQENVEYIQTDFLDWYTEGKFDVVLCSQTLEHITDDKVALFAQRLFSLCKNGGEVLITVPYLWVARRA
jgi:ubiquinone/menaquinone biosynthesis C-methylase UbiE